MCYLGGPCIQKKDLCNGVKDCLPDGSDESPELCASSSFVNSTLVELSVGTTTMNLDGTLGKRPPPQFAQIRRTTVAPRQSAAGRVPVNTEQAVTGTSCFPLPLSGVM